MAYGDGSIYLRGNRYWAQWYENGKLNRKPTKKRTEVEARKFLRDRLYEASNGLSTPASSHKVTMADLFQAVINDYEKNDYSSIKDLRRKLKLHLVPEFGHLRPDQMTSDRIESYMNMRKRKSAANGSSKGATNATINRELSVIIRSFTLAVESTPPKVTRVPKIKRLVENNVREGFLADSEFERIATACIKRGLWLLGILLVGFTYGWRSDEITSILRAGHVDLVRHCLMLPPNVTKNGQARIVRFMPGSALEKVLASCCKGKKPWEPLFTRPDGSPVKAFHGAWHSACVEAGLGHWICRSCRSQLHEGCHCPGCNERIPHEKQGYSGLLVHDLRRTAARNARTAGVPETIIMKMGGWKTRSVFIRYAIVDESDQDQAIRKIEEHRAKISGRPLPPEALSLSESSSKKPADSRTPSGSREEPDAYLAQNYVLPESWEDLLEKMLSHQQPSGGFPKAQSLYEEVWAQPVRVVAQKYNISDVGLAKRCRRLGIPLPPRGYWAKLSAKKQVPQRPLFRS